MTSVPFRRLSILVEAVQCLRLVAGQLVPDGGVRERGERDQDESDERDIDRVVFETVPIFGDLLICSFILAKLVLGKPDEKGDSRILNDLILYKLDKAGPSSPSGPSGFVTANDEDRSTFSVSSRIEVIRHRVSNRVDQASIPS